MGQYDIFTFLEANVGKWFSMRDLCTEMNISRCASSRGVHKLLSGGLIRIRYVYIRDRKGGYDYSKVLDEHNRFRSSHQRKLHMKKTKNLMLLISKN